MTDEERQVQAITEFYHSFGEPAFSWPELEFERVAYSRWAIEEILVMVYSHLDWTPMRAVEEFKNLMRDYANMTFEKDFGRGKMNFVFETAYDAACDVSDILLAMG